MTLTFKPKASPRIWQALLALSLLVATCLSWIPTLQRLANPIGDQIWEQFGIAAVCSDATFKLGWLGEGQSLAMANPYTGSLPASLVSSLSCQLARHTTLLPLQASLLVGLGLTFLLTTLACRVGRFRWSTSLVAAFLIATAPCAFSRAPHISLATLWPVIPGLIACICLWRTMLGMPSTIRAIGAGTIAALLCFPVQEYYLFFNLLLLSAAFLLFLFLATTNTRDPRTLWAWSSKGIGFGIGFASILALSYIPKFIGVSTGSGPPVSWAIPRFAVEQFNYGLLPFTWVIPSPWVPMVKQALIDSRIDVSTEPFFWSTGSFLIPIAWMVAIWQTSQSRCQTSVFDPATSSDAPKGLQRSDLRLFAVLLAMTTFIGLFWMTPGGLGVIFSVVVSPSLRALNRYTPYVYGASILLIVAQLDLQLSAWGWKR